MRTHRSPVLATPFIRAIFRRELAMIHSTGATKSTPLWSLNGHVEPTYAMRQEPVGASVICRQPTLSLLTEPARPNLVTGTLADLPRSRAELLAENALLRQQLMVLRRTTKTPRLTWRERLSLVFLARLVPNWKQVLVTIQACERLALA